MKVGMPPVALPISPSENKVAEQEQVLKSANLGPNAANLSKRDDMERNLHVSLDEAVKDIEEYTKLQDVGMVLKIDRDLDNSVIIKLIDKEKEEVIRQIPSEEAVALAKHLRKVFDGLHEDRQKIAGSFINDQV